METKICKHFIGRLNQRLNITEYEAWKDFMRWLNSWEVLYSRYRNTYKIVWCYGIYIRRPSWWFITAYKNNSWIDNLENFSRKKACKHKVKLVKKSFK